MLVYVIFLECIFYKIYKLNAWPTAGDMKSGQQDHLYATYRNIISARLACGCLKICTLMYVA